MHDAQYPPAPTLGLCRCGCGEPTPLAARNHAARGWIKGQPKPYIHGHNARKHRAGIEAPDGTVLIPLAGRHSTVAHAVIDVADTAEIAALAWYRGSRGYAMRQYRVDGRTSTRVEMMHRRIMGLVRGDGLEVDHINRNKLDNRRANLRVVTRAENEQNKIRPAGGSGHRNVVWYASRGCWVARLKIDGKWKIKTGFRTPEAASVAAEELRRIWHPYAAE